MIDVTVESSIAMAGFQGLQMFRMAQDMNLLLVFINLIIII